MEGIARFLKSLKTIRIQNFCPKVEVVARRIAIAGKQMPEMDRTVAQRHALRHADLSQEGGFKFCQTQVFRRRMPMQSKINQRARQILYHRETLPIIARGQHAGEQRLIQGCAGFMVSRMGLQGLRQAQPIFHDLRGEFDKITKHGGAGLGWIACAAHQPMQRMAEFMKQRARLIEGKQRWCRAGEVIVVDDDGRGAPGEAIGHAKAAHPGAGSLAGAGVIIEQQ